MGKTLIKVGNSQALVLDKPVLQAMGVTEDTELNFTLVGRKLIISPADEGIGPDRVREHTRRIRKKYDRTLKNLAK